jgi:hypothetical protein
MDVLMQRVKTAEVRHMRFPMKGGAVMDQTNINWGPASTYGSAQGNGKGYLALLNGSLSYTGGPGFSGAYHDLKEFHGRMVAYTVSSGLIEVTARISVLEELGSTPNGFFDTSTASGDAQPIETVVMDEAELRKNLVSSKPFAWPPAADGPLQGMAGSRVVLDRSGKVRDLDRPLSDNPAMVPAAEEGFRSMQFQPVLRNGVPVQATGPLSIAFNTIRPGGVETFDSARTYFERGRKLSCLGAGATAPYLLRAGFEARGESGGVTRGRYEDTWIGPTEWKREAWFESSHLVRSQVGDTRYVVSEGPAAGLLRTVMLSLEPIPAIDTMTESDWRVRTDSENGVRAIRVSRGPERAKGELDPAESQVYWFDTNGPLVKAYVQGLEILPADIQVYAGVQVARRIDLSVNGQQGMQLTVQEIGSADASAVKTFKQTGHEWQRAFTGEVR